MYRDWTGSAVVALATLACAITGAIPVRAGGAIVTLAERLALLKQAYPDHVTEVGPAEIVMADGSRIAIDDGKAKTHADKLAHADVEDMLFDIYPVIGCTPSGWTPTRNFDPGRIRSHPFFASVYGRSRGEVAARLVPVPWFGETLPVTRTMGVNEKLAAVVGELASTPGLEPNLVPSGGTFVWRSIAGTRNLSAHAYAIAIDIVPHKADYWRWSKLTPGAAAAARDRIPAAIVAAFERHGFIWGGNWDHYDTMHFEYRPELIAIGNLARSRGCAN